MRAWIFQATRQKEKLGDHCPWFVGWYDAEGRRRQKCIGSKSMAEKYCRKVEGELAAGLCSNRKRTKWADFRNQFLDVAMAGKAEGTIREYRDALDSFARIVKPVYMDTIGTASIDTYKAKRAKEQANAPIRRKRNAKERAAQKAAIANPRPVSPATVNKELRHIRAALRKAWRWGMLAQPPEVKMLREPKRDPFYIDDATFKKLYEACDAMARPADRHYAAADWWKALLCFAYMTGWRIGEILALRRADLDLDAGIATVDAESTKGRREARVELHPVVIEHLRGIASFGELVFEWSDNRRLIWTDFTALKKAAGAEFKGAFHRFRFGFANANVDALDAKLLQTLMRHQSQATTQHYINMAERLKRSGVATKLHVPAFLQTATG